SRSLAAEADAGRARGQYRWQAVKRSGFTSRQAGSSVRQCGMALGQRGWKRQPVGGLIGLGISPDSTMRWRRVPGWSGRAAESSACVYGWSGAAYTASHGPVSTSLPEYMTARLV